MGSERDEYDVFLDNWKPSEILEHATLEGNLQDPLAQARLVEDSSGEAELTRTPFVQGIKTMSDVERGVRKYTFFETHQDEWSAHFQDYVRGEGVDQKKLEQFVHCFATIWVDGKSRRQGSPEMMAIKASIRDYDRHYHTTHAGRFVLTPIPDEIAPLFEIAEMKVIFRANERLLESFIPDYLRELEGPHGGSVNFVTVRRGAMMPKTPGSLRKELHYLSSYSLALEPVEQFAKTWTPATKESGVPCIFSAPLPALQQRVVAFAPFIEGMDLGQLELVVAPPVEPVRLAHHGEYGGIHDYWFE